MGFDVVQKFQFKFHVVQQFGGFEFYCLNSFFGNTIVSGKIPTLKQKVWGLENFLKLCSGKCISNKHSNIHLIVMDELFIDGAVVSLTSYIFVTEEIVPI